MPEGQGRNKFDSISNRIKRANPKVCSSRLSPPPPDCVTVYRDDDEAVARVEGPAHEMNLLGT